MEISCIESTSLFIIPSRFKLNEEYESDTTNTGRSLVKKKIEKKKGVDSVQDFSVKLFKVAQLSIININQTTWAPAKFSLVR